MLVKMRVQGLFEQRIERFKEVNGIRNNTEAFRALALPTLEQWEVAQAAKGNGPKEPEYDDSHMEFFQ